MKPTAVRVWKGEVPDYNVDKVGKGIRGPRKDWLALLTFAAVGDVEKTSLVVVPCRE